MTKQKSPHTQTEQNTTPELFDLEPDQLQNESGSKTDDQIYARMEGAETGGNRSPKKSVPDGPHHNTEPEMVSHEGPVHTRTPKRPSQGITSRSAAEESERQKKVVNERPDAGRSQSFQIENAA